MRWFQQLVRRWRTQRTLGQRGELAAQRYLKRRGYTVVARGERGRIGELDLVAVDGRTVVFVEVKTRRTHNAGAPVEAVHAAKQRQLTRAALSYLRRHDLLECRARFDVVAITWPNDSSRPAIEHIKQAFEPTGRGQFFS